ncbi:hypothetical protein QFZ31_001127 [Neobacillus niacini]|uniref:hypothetical protein n=1 Tax=Neobacillus driksii TaxID=3035913 RepID=UPI00277F0F88|nr:hypothetical protein [Neobacillus niacini]MDQ0971249.1 hypothetical protein [Neobacillus niacini]
MKKILYILVVFIVLLSACNSESEKNQDQADVGISKTDSQAEPKDSVQKLNVDLEDQLNEESIESQPREIAQPLNETIVKEILEFQAKGEGEKLLNYSFVDSTIKATFELAPNKRVPAKDLAVRRYRQISDELLPHEGWEILEITYTNIGKIRMNRNEKEPNENGGYFTTKKIEDRLK